MRYEEMRRFWQRAKEGGRKSFCYEELDAEFFFTGKGGILVPYLDGMQKDLSQRD